MLKKTIYPIIAVLTIGLVNALVPLEDATGNGYNLTNSNAVYNTTGQRYEFNGANAKLTSPVLGKANNLQFSITMTFVDRGALNHADKGLIQEGAYPDTTVSWRVAYKKFVVGCQNNSNSWQGLSGGAYDIVPNTAYNAALVYNNKNILGYVNGVLYSNFTFSSNCDTDKNTWMIGATSDPYYWNGSLDDVRIFNRSLSLSEIQTINSSGDVSDGLVAWYPFTNGTTQSNPCIYSGTGHYVISNAVCNVTSNYTVQTGYDFNVTNSTIYFRGGSWVRGFHEAHWLSGWIHMVSW